MLSPFCRRWRKIPANVWRTRGSDCSHLPFGQTVALTRSFIPRGYPNTQSFEKYLAEISCCRSEFAFARLIEMQIRGHFAGFPFQNASFNTKTCRTYFSQLPLRCPYYIRYIPSCQLFSTNYWFLSKTPGSVKPIIFVYFIQFSGGVLVNFCFGIINFEIFDFYFFILQFFWIFYFFSISVFSCLTHPFFCAGSTNIGIKNYRLPSPPPMVQ